MAFFSKEKFGQKAKERQTRVKEHTILLVDDEEPNLRGLKRLLEKDYNLLVAKNGEEALNLVKNDPDPPRIHLIISDQRMPNMTGVEFLKNTLDIIPKTIRILLTGFTDLDAVVDSINEGHIYEFVTKPYDPKELKVTVQRALESFELDQKNQKLLKIFEKFVPKQFLVRVAPEGLENFQDGRAKMENLSIFFSDIRAFMKLAETMTPQETLDFLNSYYQHINQPIHKNHGFIDKFIGDGIMALFDRMDGNYQLHAQDSVKAAIALQGAVNEFNSKRDASSQVRVGVGIHTGETVVGTICSIDRMESTALGDCINQAARLNSLTKFYQAKILISESTYRLLDHDEFHVRKIDTTRVKGKAQPVTIYEVFDADGAELVEKKKATQALLEEGVQCFNSSKFQQAREHFESCSQIFPQDLVVNQYLDRIHHMEKNFHLGKSNLVLRQFQNNLQALMKRGHERFKCQTPIQYSLVAEDEYRDSELVNISRTGMLFQSDQMFDSGVAVMIKTSFASTPFEAESPLCFLGRIVVRARVTKSVEASLTKYYGFEFIHCSENDKQMLHRIVQQLEMDE